MKKTKFRLGQNIFYYTGTGGSHRDLLRFGKAQIIGLRWSFQEDCIKISICENDHEIILKEEQISTTKKQLIERFEKKYIAEYKEICKNDLILYKRDIRRFYKGKRKEMKKAIKGAENDNR